MLLFDQNLSPRLVVQLDAFFPGSVHVRSVGLAMGSDLQVWAYAREQGLAIVSKDSDFHHLSFFLGAPPRVVWVQLGNCTTGDIASLLRTHADAVHSFLESADAAFLALG